MNEVWEEFANRANEKEVLENEIAHIRSVLKRLSANPFKVTALCFYVMVEDGTIIDGTPEENILTIEHGRLDAVDFLVDFAKAHVEEAVVALV